jgi:hypothetical protein
MPDFLADVPLIIHQELQFMHDGAPTHFILVHRYLNRKFPCQWIGRSGPIAWPPRSPDLNPLDFYLSGNLKSSVYSAWVDDVETLRTRIVAGFQTISNMLGIWDCLRVAMRCQVEVCIEAGGGHLEHLLQGNVKS